MIMKIHSLIPALAALAFAVSAPAQSDPSVGGSFAGTHPSADSVDTPHQKQGINTSPNANVQTHSSFWDRLTGRNANMSQGSTRRTDNNRGWFGKHQVSPNKSDHHQSWFSRHLNASKDQAQSKPANTRASKGSNGWHLPFFHR